MKPYQHARGSVQRWGGKPEDYLPLHDFFDQTKAAMPDLRHRAVLHNAMGIFLLERVFGPVITNSDGKQVCTRDVGEHHVLEDMGFIPSLEDWLENLPQEVWHGGIHRIAKDQRPPTPSEAREAMRARVRDVLLERVSLPANGPSVALIDTLIAAVRGTTKED